MTLRPASITHGLRAACVLIALVPLSSCWVVPGAYEDSFTAGVAEKVVDERGTHSSGMQALSLVFLPAAMACDLLVVPLMVVTEDWDDGDAEGVGRFAEKVARSLVRIR